MNGSSSYLPFLSRVANISSLLRTNTHSPAFSFNVRHLALDISYDSLVSRRHRTTTALIARFMERCRIYRTHLLTVPLRTPDACVYHLISPSAPHKMQKL